MDGATGSTKTTAPPVVGARAPGPISAPRRDPAMSGVVRVPPPEPGALVSAILVIARWLQNLSIGVWVGALVTIGMFVAPVIGHQMSAPVDAGRIVGPVADRITKAGVVLGITYLVLLFVHDSLWHRYHRTTSGDLVLFLKFAVAAAMVLGSLYLWLRVTPLMNHYLASSAVVNGRLTGGAGAAFDRWHLLYEQIAKATAGGGVLLLLLNQLVRRRR